LVERRVGRDRTQFAAIAIDDEDVIIAGAITVEGDLAPIWRPTPTAVVRQTIADVRERPVAKIENIDLAVAGSIRRESDVSTVRRKVRPEIVPRTAGNLRDVTAVRVHRIELRQRTA